MDPVDIIIGTTGPDVIVGDPLHDLLEGPDRITTGAGDDHVESDPQDGVAGDDVVDGNAGADYLDGGAGDDRLTGGPGGDTLIGGEGSDTADYRHAADPLLTGLVNEVQVDLAAGLGRYSDGAGDVLSGIENVVGSAVYHNALFGSEAGNRLVGGAGNDHLRGAPNMFTPGAGNDLLYGGAGNDYIGGGSGNDRLSGGEGADVFYFVAETSVRIGGIPTDVPVAFGYDRIVDFDAGEDILQLIVRNPLGLGDLTLSPYTAASGSGTRVSVHDGAAIFLQGVAPDELTAANFDFLGFDSGLSATLALAEPIQLAEPIPLAAAPDIITGTTGDDLILPGDPGDPYYDLLVGDDRIVGGRGDDTIVADSPGGPFGNDVVAGNDGDDFISGGGGDDRLIGGAGADSLLGGEGSDTADYRNAPATDGHSDRGVQIRLQTGYTQGSHAEGDVLLGIENLVGTGITDWLFGDTGANRLNGRGGDDLLVGDPATDGPGGNDLLYGGDGDDFIVGGPGDDRLSGGAGADTFQFITEVYYPLQIDEAGNFELFIRTTPFGEDRIVDFDAAEDFLDFRGWTALASLVLTGVTHDDGSVDTVISRSDLTTAVGTITLAGVVPDELTAANFLFEPASWPAETPEWPEEALFLA